MGKTTTKKPVKKPKAPWDNFPLFPHASGQWCKKIRGRPFYFGVWADPEGAEKRYQEVKDDLHAGRTPRPKSAGGGLTLEQLSNRFLNAKRHRRESGELNARTFGEYHAACEHLINAFGKTRLVTDLLADDFAKYRAQLTERLGPVALGNEIQRVRSLFKFGYENGLIENPVRFGTEFVKPSRRTIRIAKSGRPQRTLTAAEITKLLKLAGPQMQAMILLGINCGFGNGDVAAAPLTAFDLGKGIVDYPRPKSGVERRAVLWPETVKALKAVIAKPRAEKEPEAAGLVFITKYGRRWVRNTETKRVDGVGREFAKLLTEAGIKREGLNFYALRHTFKTVADETRDIPAVNRIMGHHDPSIGGVYRHWNKDAAENARLKAVADHVRKWLFPRGGKKVK